MQIETQICNKLGIIPTTILKKKIRGLPGYTVLDLIEALVHTDTLVETGEYLGYSINPIKQSIKEVLSPLFPNRSQQFGDGGGIKPWRTELLSVINSKFCAKCNCIKLYTNFYSNVSNTDGYSAYCKPCSLLDSKKHKRYIEERTPIWSDLELIDAFYKACPIGYHVDHIIPLRGRLVSGLHVLSNLQYLTAEDNLIKNNKYIIE